MSTFRDRQKHFEADEDSSYYDTIKKPRLEECAEEASLGNDSNKQQGSNK